MKLIVFELLLKLILILSADVRFVNRWLKNAENSLKTKKSNDVIGFFKMCYCAGINIGNLLFTDLVLPMPLQHKNVKSIMSATIRKKKTFSFLKLTKIK